MKKWPTYIYAISATTGKVEKFVGPKIEAPSAKLAQEWCNQNGMGYCIVQTDVIAYEVTYEVDNN